MTKVLERTRPKSRPQAVKEPKAFPARTPLRPIPIFATRRVDRDAPRTWPTSSNSGNTSRKTNKTARSTNTEGSGTSLKPSKTEILETHSYGPVSDADVTIESKESKIWDPEDADNVYASPVKIEKSYLYEDGSPNRQELPVGPVTLMAVQATLQKLCAEVR